MSGDRRYGARAPRITVQCQSCGKEFVKMLSVARKVDNHFCSKKCFGKSIENDPADFWLFVRKQDSGCWEWMAGRNNSGYGCWRVDGKNVRTHRYSYEIAFGPIPNGLHVLHRCDNRPCVNPDHLFLGTNYDNVQDRNSKDRAGLKLKKKDVQEIIDKCQSGRTQQSVADEYGVSPSYVSKLCSGIGKVASLYVGKQ